MVTKEQLEYHQKMYSLGKPEISDEEYDALVEEYVREHGEDSRPFSRQKQSDAVNDIVGTLPKVYGTTKPMREGQLVYIDWLKKHDSTKQIIVQPKFDGCSVAFDFETERFYTRGDYDNGESLDVTGIFYDHIQVIKSQFPQGTKAAKFEAILSHEKFYDMDLNKKYRRPRDFVAATITSRNREWGKLLRLIPLRGYVGDKQFICEDWFYNIRLESDDTKSIDTFIKNLLSDDAAIQVQSPTDILSGETFSVDGVVVSKINGSKDKLCVVDPDNEVAIKILYNVKQTKLLNVEYQIGKQGRITPVAILEPVQFDTVTVSRVTLSTLDRVAKLNLRYNDTVNIMYNIVPYLIDSLSDGDVPIPIPTKCPVCGSDLVYLSLKQVTCMNPDCLSRKIGALVRHVTKMKIMGLSEGIITRLYNEGIIQRISDIYRLRDFSKTIINMDGFGEKSYNNLIESIDTALSKATLARFLGSLPIDDTDEKTWDLIIKVLGEDTVIKSLRNQTFVDVLCNAGYIANIGKFKMNKIALGVTYHKDEISELMQWVPSRLKQNSFMGYSKQKVALSGTRDAKLTEELESSGFSVTDTLTKDCVGLIIPSRDFKSSKVSKAESWGIHIYTIEEAEKNLILPF